MPVCYNYRGQRQIKKKIKIIVQCEEFGASIEIVAFFHDSPSLILDMHPYIM